jgi:hypothetical protein
VTLKVPAACEVEKDGVTFVVDAEPALAKPLTLSAAPKPDEPNWGALSWFLWAGLASLLWILLAYYVWAQRDSESGDDVSHSPGAPLKQLDPSWSFSDSWVANLTVAGTVVTAILGSSEVIKTFLGDEAESALALATVGGAVALAFVAAGQILVLATKKRLDGGWKAKGWVTVGGLLGGAWLTLTGAAGQLGILLNAGMEFEVGGYEDYIVPLVLVAIILLLVYSMRTLLLILEMGTNAPEVPAIPDSRLLVAATLRGQSGVRKDALAETIEEIEADLKKGTPKQRREQQKQKREAAKENREPPPEAKLPAGVPVRPVAPLTPPPGARSAML